MRYAQRMTNTPSPRGPLKPASPLKGEENEVDALACGAYDARLYRYRSKTIAQSPAIDRGTDDAYGYDSTSTNPKVIDMGQPDLGYHYYRRVADDDPVDDPNTTEVEESDQTVEITFRQPNVVGIDAYSVSKRYKGDVLHIYNYLADDPYVKDKEVALIPFEDEFEYGQQQILVETVVGSNSSTPAEVNLIVDPFAPEIKIEQ